MQNCNAKYSVLYFSYIWDEIAQVSWKTLASCSSVDKNELNQFGRPAALIQ